MGLHYYHLDDPEVRARSANLWEEERQKLQRDYPRDQWPYGKLLTEQGLEVFLEAMPKALRDRDDEWLRETMGSETYWQPYQRRRKPKGGYTQVDYNRADALSRLTIGEFNTAYVRGLTSTLLDRGETSGLVYRAGEAAEERTTYCTQLEDSLVELEQLLHDHRANYWPTRRSDARPIPSGPNCHHSVRSVQS